MWKENIMKKRVIALGMSLALAGSLAAGCGSSSGSGSSADTQESAAAVSETSASSETSAAQESNGKTRPTTSGQKDNTLTTSYSGQVDTIDPELFTKQDEDTVLSQVYEPLFLYNNEGELDPYVAESWTENEDGSVDFTLRDITFHSGDKLTSEDVEYTFSRTENSPVGSALYGNIVINVTDDTHFTMTFENGNTFEDLAGYIQAMGIVNKSYCETVISDPNEDLGFNEDGSGPYIFSDIADNGDITLTKYDGYWGDVSIDTLYFKHLTGSAEVAFESGDLDVAAYSATNYPTITAYDNVEGYSQPLNRIYFFILKSSDDGKFVDIRTRQAFAYAMNHQDIVDIASDASGTIAYNLATPLTQYYTDNAEHYDQDLDKAAQLLEEAGYSDSNKLSFTVIANGSSNEAVAACEVLKEELEQTHFEVNIEEISDSTRIYSGDFDAAFSSIGLLPSYKSYRLMFDMNSGLDFAQINDSSILDAFDAISDEASAQNAMKVSTESLAYVPLYYPATFLVYDAGLTVGEYNTSLSCYLFHEFSWK